MAVLLTACGNVKKTAVEATTATSDPVGPAFVADSAYLFCQQQCDFGPRTMNSEAHERCGEWIADKFRQYGMEVTLQKADLRGYDGTILHSTNIIAQYQPALTKRILLCAHWDSRPWADNDPDAANHRQPVMAANDGASGVAVMLEIARLLQADTLSVGVDFVCFDAEDWGTPQWAEGTNSDGDTWALGAQYWSEHLLPYTSNLLPHLWYLFRYSIGVIPVCSLKYLPKNEALGKSRSLAISCIVMSVKRSRCLMALSVKKRIVSLGLRFIVSLSSVERYFGVTFS